MGCGVWGVGCGVWGVECGVWGLRFGIWGLGSGILGLGSGVWGSRGEGSGLSGAKPSTKFPKAASSGVRRLRQK